MIGSHRVTVTLLISTLSALAACAPSTNIPPVDPVKEQIAVVQRQLLELQKVQLETRKKVDEQATGQTSANDSLSAKVKALEKALEDHKNAAPPPAPVITKPTSDAQAAPLKKATKKPAKKKKKKPAVQSPQ